MTVSLDFTRLSSLKNFMNSMKYFMEKMKNYGQDEYLNKSRIPKNFQTREILSHGQKVN